MFSLSIKYWFEKVLCFPENSEHVYVMLSNRDWDMRSDYVYLDSRGRGFIFAYPGRTPLILCSVAPSGQGVQMTHSLLVTARVPDTREILDGRMPTVYLPV